MWTTYDGAEVTSAFKGISIPMHDLTAAVASRGWELTKVKWGSEGYEAEAKNPTTGDKVKKTGPDPQTAVGHLLMALTRLDFIRLHHAKTHLGMWETTFTGQLPEVAQAYAKAPVYDPSAVAAWVELAQDSVSRARALGQQLKIEVTDNPSPYATPQEMCEDITKRKHFLVSRANAHHPVWSVDENVAFRTVHDVLGHCVSGGDFGWEGENRACAAHFPLLSPLAQKALFTECIGQTAYVSYYRGFGPQKVAFLDKLLEAAQEKENPENHQGTHPSQSVAPIEVPQVAPSTDENQASPFPQGWGFQPHIEQAINQTAPAGAEVFAARKTGTVYDPNYGWQSGVEPLQRADGGSQTDWGDPFGVRRRPVTPEGEGQNAWDMGQRLQRQWYEEPYPAARRAVINAFRVALLSPRKDLRWNTIQYQHIMDMDPTGDPMKYHERLEQRRGEWNVARKADPEGHRAYADVLPQYRAWLRDRHPKWSEATLERRLRENVRRMMDRNMEQLETEYDATEVAKPEDEKTSLVKVYFEASEMTRDQLLKILNPKSDPATDREKVRSRERQMRQRPWALPENDQHSFFPAHFGHSRKHEAVGAVNYDPYAYLKKAPRVRGEHPPGQLDFSGVENPEFMGLYSPWMGNQIEGLAIVDKKADVIAHAALADVKDYGGTGYHFRAQVLALNIPMVGPKVASFAWLLLMPTNSQLATIDTHMMDMLGYEPNDLSNRDYFRAEREFRGRMDGLGYHEEPLGLLQWAAWDYKRSGPDSHQDHSAMAVLSPTPHDMIDWNAKMAAPKGEEWAKNAPEWWQNTEPLAEPVRQHWDETMAPEFGRDEYPLFERKHYFGSASTESHEFHVAWALPEDVRRRIADWVATLDWPEGYELEEPDEYHITALYAHGGWEDANNHHLIRQRFRSTGLPFRSTGLDLFGGEEGSSVVIRLDAPEAGEVAKTMMNAAEARGLEVSRFPGGYKAHITVGSAPALPEGAMIDLDFRGGSLYISTPRDLPEEEHVLDPLFSTVVPPQPWFVNDSGDHVVGSPGATLMQHMRNHMGLDTLDVWKLPYEAGKK